MYLPTPLPPTPAHPFQRVMDVVGDGRWGVGGGSGWGRCSGECGRYVYLLSESRGAAPPLRGRFGSSLERRTIKFCTWRRKYKTFERQPCVICANGTTEGFSSNSSWSFVSNDKARTVHTLPVCPALACPGFPFVYLAKTVRMQFAF